MKNPYSIISMLAMVLFAELCSAQEIQKNYINYQGIAWDSNNEAMASEHIIVGIALKFGNANSAPQYQENHSVTTDANGVFSLLIGTGIGEYGNYDELPWGTAATFATISLDGKEVVTTEFMAVPFAIASGDNQWISNDGFIENKNSGDVSINDGLRVAGDLSLQVGGAVNEISSDGTLLANSDEILATQKAVKTYVDNNLSGGNGTDNQSLVLTGNILSIENGGGTVDLGAYIEDADADINNELQTLSFDPTTNELILSDGGSVIIPTGGTDADADPTNEIQDISLTGTELTISEGSTIDLAPIVPPGGSDDQNLVLSGNELSIENGTGSVDLSEYRDDADADPTNEIQRISFDATTNKISLTDGGEITIPSGGTDADADPVNELQSLSFDDVTNELSLSDGGSVIIPTGGTDADADPANELQNLSLSGTTLNISDGTGVDLTPIIPPGGTDDQNLVLTSDVLSIEGGTGTVDLSTYTNDADADPANEFQTLSFDAGTNELSLSDGNSVTIPSGGTDADADPANELQNLSLSGTTLNISDGTGVDLTPIIPPGGTDDQNLVLTGDVLSIEGGTGTVDLSSYGDDADADPANELQSLSFDDVTNELSLSDGGSVIIPTGGADADADPANELQNLSLSGTILNISDGTGVDLTPIIPPGGTDDQNLVLTGDVLSIEGGTGTVDLSTYGDDADADPTNEIDVTAQSGLLLGNGTTVSGLVGDTDGQVAKWDAATNAWVPGADETAAPGSATAWNLNGNAGTDPTIDFIGTTDSQPLVFKVNGELAGHLNWGGEEFFLDSRQD